MELPPPDPSVQVFLDVSRLVSRVRRESASGIDRVELQYALRLDREKEIRLVPVAWIRGRFMELPRRIVSPLMRMLASRWSGAGGSPFHAPLRRLAGRRRLFERFLLLVGRDVKRATAYRGRVVYLNVSHKHLTKLDRVRDNLPTSDGRIIVLLHDLMPINHPSYYPEALRRDFEAGLNSVSRFADVVIANSVATGGEWSEHCRDAGIRSPRLEVNRLGVDVAPGLLWSPSGDPYCVFLGTLGPRKNVELLLACWGRLAGGSERAPRLVLVGAEGDAIATRLEELPEPIRSRVEIRSGLDDRGVWSLLCAARALLLPSRAEGFGLPIAEAGAIGLPVLCTDLAAHREFGDWPVFLPDGDLEAWTRAIAETCSRDPVSVTPRSTISWAEHVTRTVALFRD